MRRERLDRIQGHRPPAAELGLTQPAFPTASYVWTGMKSGKLDEELTRMSAIVDAVKPTAAGERLLQTVGHRIEDKGALESVHPAQARRGLH